MGRHLLLVATLSSIILLAAPPASALARPGNKKTNASKHKQVKQTKPAKTPDVYKLGKMVVRRNRLIIALTSLKSALGAPVSGAWSDKYKLVCRAQSTTHMASHLHLHAVYLCMTNWSWFLRHASAADGVSYHDGASPTKPFYIKITPMLKWMMTHINAVKRGKKPPAWMRRARHGKK